MSPFLHGEERMACHLATHGNRRRLRLTRVTLVFPYVECKNITLLLI